MTSSVKERVELIKVKCKYLLKMKWSFTLLCEQIFALRILVRGIPDMMRRLLDEISQSLNHQV